MRSFSLSLQAISHVVAALIMIAVVITGALIYAWFMGYSGSSTEKGEKAIEIQNVANLDNDLLVLVKNVGEEAVQLKEISCLYVNGILVPCTISDAAGSDGVATLNEEETATLTFVGGAALSEEEITVKVTTLSGVSADYSGYPAENTSTPSVLDHFVFTTVESPQISGKSFNVTVEARDQWDSLFTSYSGVNTLFYSGGTMNPTLTGGFTNGVWTGTVTVNGPATNATLTTTAQSNSSKNGTSNIFEVVYIEPTTLWNQTYGDRNWTLFSTRDEVPYALVETSDGGFALAGESTEPGNLSVYLVGWFVKADKFGNMEWNKTYPGITRSLIATSDGGYIIAGYLESSTDEGFADSDFWLAKTDDHGNIEWSKKYGGSDREQAYSMVETPDGGYALAGENSFGSVPLVDDLDYRSNDFLLVKIDEFGNMEWNQTYGDPVDNERAVSLVVTPDGGFAIAGPKRVYDLEREPDRWGFIPNNGTLFWLVKADAYGNMEWNQTYGGTDILPNSTRHYSSELHCLLATSDGGYLLGGDTNQFNMQQFGMWIIKVDENGVEEWNRTYIEASLAPAHPKYEYANSMVETPDGGYLIAGAATGGFSLLMKTNSTGHMEWNQTYNNGMAEASTVLIATSDGGYAAAGHASHYVPNVSGGYFVGIDFWLLKTNERGIIPEFSSWIILPFLLLTALIAVISLKKVKI